MGNCSKIPASPPPPTTLIPSRGFERLLFSVSSSPVSSLALCEGVPVWWLRLKLGIEPGALGFSSVFLVPVEMLLSVCVDGLRLSALGLRLGFWLLERFWVWVFLGGPGGERRRPCGLMLILLWGCQ